MAAIVDYYETLGVAQTATETEIKKAYRKLSLKYHPDRNYNNVEESTLLFREINAAYSVLSDPNERAFYDSNRDSILLGLDTAGTATNVPIFSYMSPSCFNGFSDDGAGFYAIYRRAFTDLAYEESLCPSFTPLPSFGDSKSPLNDVSQFYLHWENFSTKKSMSHEKEYNLNHAPNREIRRLMDKENKNTVSSARRGFNDKVRLLASVVKRRDPRVVMINAQKMAQAEETKRRQQEMALAKEESKRKAREERMRRMMELEEEESVEEEEEEVVEVDRNQAFVEDIFEMDSLNIATTTHESDDNEEFYCQACKKKFSSEGQLKNHENSRKHKQAVAKAGVAQPSPSRSLF
ncbi:hypothetical protein GEMRC1_003628 [Eukaryota sp. GEM-RC1]